MSKDPKFPIYLYPDAQYGELKNKLIFESEVYEQADEIQSQWKKPYLNPEHPQSERELALPGTSPYIPSGGGIGTGDCEPQGNGIGGGWLICDPSDNCGLWIYSCAHKIKSIIPINGWFKSITFKPDDTVEIVFCSDNDFGTIVFELHMGLSIEDNVKRDCLGDDPSPSCTTCVDCPVAFLSIGYSSQQMSVNGTQSLSVSGKGGGGPYSWSILSGGGTISTVEGTGTVYTAPSSNANCALNPTIQLMDYCGNKVTIAIAVNGWSGNDAAYDHVADVSAGGVVMIRSYQYTCAGVELTNVDCGSCQPTCFVSPPPCCNPPEGTGCTLQCVIDNNCSSNSRCYACSLGYVDIRDSTLLSGGCCPVALL